MVGDWAALILSSGGSSFAFARVAKAGRFVRFVRPSQCTVHRSMLQCENLMIMTMITMMMMMMMMMAILMMMAIMTMMPLMMIMMTMTMAIITPLMTMMPLVTMMMRRKWLVPCSHLIM